MYIAGFEYVIENNLERPGLQQIRNTLPDYRHQPQQQDLEVGPEQVFDCQRFALGGEWASGSTSVRRTNGREIFANERQILIRDVSAFICGYSKCSARMGSIDAARRAGTKFAKDPPQPRLVLRLHR